ncbi:uncharacterized protein N7469_000446 [Penicillium citrinum]|uniref:DEUBAD domain-containing protein n=1 Tax=Penicillium citrinum TaxID=5077 RepID=A0A9W9PCS1_PENCI|nr:uncharacterized protein N7469_000446 [Penicillium citrinum]KAJ5242119.1 hypothetical protein N7469_000446 [Penicillium citrinum]
MSNEAKRTPRKAAPRGKWSEAQLLTSDKSLLIDADLVKLLARPEAWNCLDENEKREILALLPADTHPDAETQQDDPNAKIPPLPTSFLRYSNNWRDGIRQFQLDLQNGRYDPEWLRQAEQARKQRENGDFDSFKEQEFEQFWGQKQRLNKKLLAGESAKVRLSELIDAGVILLGDVWRFRYFFKTAEVPVTVDKEGRVSSFILIFRSSADKSQIDEIDGARISFTFPTGTRTFLSTTAPGTKKTEVAAESDTRLDVTVTASQEIPAGVSEISTDQKKQVVEHNIKAKQPNTGASENAPRSTAEMTANMTAKDPPSLITYTSVPDSTEDPDEVIDSAQFSNLASSASEGGAPDRPHDEQNGGSVQVIIVNKTSSPRTADETLKRPTPPSESEPPPKRQRGRPRKQTQENASSSEDVATTPKTPRISVEIMKSNPSPSNEKKIPEQSSENMPSDIEATAPNQPAMTPTSKDQEPDQLEDKITSTTTGLKIGETKQNRLDFDPIDDPISRNELASSPSPRQYHLKSQAPPKKNARSNLNWNNPN